MTPVSIRHRCAAEQRSSAPRECIRNSHELAAKKLEVLPDVTRAPDPIAPDHRVAALYDVFEHDRTDLDVYDRIVDEFGARSVLDIGCGTGELASRLARRGVAVIGVDPDEASLAIARAKPGVEPVTWIAGVLTVDSTLRFRSRDEVEHSLVATGFGLVDIRDAPDRPGKEFVFIARRLRQPARPAQARMGGVLR